MTALHTTLTLAPAVLGFTQPLAKPIPPDVAARMADLVSQTEQLNARVAQLASDVMPHAARVDRLSVFHGYIAVFAAAFLVALIATPLMRRLAIANGVIDRPSVARKIHKAPVAYLGGVAVYLGIMAGALIALTQPFHGFVEFHTSRHAGGEIPVRPMLAVLAGLSVIMLCGLIDDVRGIDPRAKVAGMLFAAAALATQDVGVKVAAGLMFPIASALGIGTTEIQGATTIGLIIPVPGTTGLPIDLVYWVGTAVIAIFVVGACNASNLIDGLDGLLSGTTAISAMGLLFIALTLAVTDDGPLDAMRVVLCLALLGGCLGFLPHNFNPATIFLGDAGSLMLGYLTIVIVLTLGDTGRTNLVVAGLIIYAIPIMDTTLAIVRRIISGKKISDADDQHLHHMLKRSLGVKGAVFVLYGIAAAFAALGIGLSAGRGRVTYAMTLVFAAFIGVTAFKSARRAHFEEQAAALAAGNAGKVERSPMPGPSGQAKNGLDPASPTAVPVRAAAEAKGAGLS